MALPLLLWFGLAVCLSYAQEARISYHGAQVLRVCNATEEFVNDLQEKGEWQLWRGPEANGSSFEVMVKQNAVSKVKELLTNKNIEFEVLIDDLQEAIDQENSLISESDLDELQGRIGHRMEWQSYHRMQDIHHYMDFLEVTYPNLCKVHTIGTSVGGHPLKVLHIASNNPNSPAVWLDGGIHAREWISPASVSYIMNQLAEHREEHSDAVQSVDWYILPLVNPDGYEYSHTSERLWRKNRRRNNPGCPGVDLNRNFGYKWGGAGASRRPCDEIYAGTQAFSEPETSAISSFVKSNKAIKAYISYHSYGQYILYPWGYASYVPPDHTDLRRVGERMAQAMRAAGGGSYRVGSSAITLYPASGGSDDWAKGSAGIKYTYTIELRDKGRYGFILPSTYIIPTAKEAFAASQVIAEEEMLKTSVVKRKQNEEETVAVTLTVEKASLLEQIKGKDEAILQLQKEVNSLKNAIEGYTNTISDQQKTMTTLKTTIAKCNAPSYSKEINTLPLSKIPRNLTSEIEKYKKQCAENVKEISRLRKNLDTLQKELEVRNSELIEVQSVKSRNEDQIKSLKATVEDLQSALKKEESLTKKYIQQQEEDQKNVHCLKKELNEMKQILKSNHPDSISSLILAANSETASSKAAAQIEFLEARVQQLEKELESKEQTTQRNMEDMQAYIQNMKVKYEEQIASLQVQVPTSKQELKGAVRKNQTPSSKGTNETSDDSRNRGPFQRCNAPISSSHGDSYLLASIKGFKQEISARDKEIRKLNKDMHDLRKTNEALQKEHKQYIQRESGFRHQGIAKGILDRKKIHTNQDNKPYNPTVFESPVEHQETIEKLEKENQHLKRELIQLEDEFRNLRTKWLEDISALQCRHDEEMDRILSQQVPSGSNPHVAELQGQLCTQQVVISHLKEQLKEMSEYREEILVLKAERDHLDKCVLELTKKVNTLRSLQTPEALHFEALQEKIEILEHRHQHREQRLQAILRDLLRRRSQQTLEESNDASATTLRERLIDKNRQLCVYQNEMDHILDSLRELQKQSKMTG